MTSVGLEGLAALAKFVQEGGTLIVEGATTTIFPAFGITSGITVEEPTNLFARGTVLKAMFTDRKSPVAYGYNSDELPVYFSQAPVLKVGGPPSGRGGGSQIPGVGMNLTPNAVPERLATLGPARKPAADATAPAPTTQPAAANAPPSPRVIMRFPNDPDDMLLSGGLAGGQALSGRAVAIDAPVGNGHVVMFANRPYWRWETHGTFFLGFNAILNWNDLDAGKAAPARTAQGGEGAR